MTIDRGALAHRRHELVTPLTHIIGYGELLLEEAGRPELAPLLEGIIGDAEELLGLINQSFGRAAAEGDIDTAWLQAQLGPALARVQAACESLQRKSAGDGAVAADVDRIATAAANLLDRLKSGPAQP